MRKLGYKCEVEFSVKTFWIWKKIILADTSEKKATEKEMHCSEEKAKKIRREQKKRNF
jgi:hypothetical protein